MMSQASGRQASASAMKKSLREQVKMRVWLVPRQRVIEGGLAASYLRRIVAGALRPRIHVAVGRRTASTWRHPIQGFQVSFVQPIVLFLPISSPFVARASLLCWASRYNPLARS